MPHSATVTSGFHREMPGFSPGRKIQYGSLKCFINNRLTAVRAASQTAGMQSCFTNGHIKLLHRNVAHKAASQESDAQSCFTNRHTKLLHKKAAHKIAA